MKPALVPLAVSLVVVGTWSFADERPGDRMLAEYFQSETARLQQATIAQVTSRQEWEAKRPELRRQLAEMLGLDPMPERTPLEPVVTGTTEVEGIVIERLHFQSRPGLYVTANFYRPQEQDGPLPAILYVCGHSNVKKEGVSFGNKAGYHHHGAWFARNGYVCLTIDTLQLGEIEGIHHGTYRYGRWWWNSRGYSPAGVEAWNCIRALDYLETRPEADADKFGVTGRSGGGAYSWYIAALDDRIKAAVPVAGITDLENHIVDGCVEGHCDCMYFVNTYRWDYPLLAALVAPRPLLISNTDKDRIFPLEGVVRTHDVVRKVYRLLGAEERLGLQITEGPHKDTQELRIHAFVWFDRYLRGEERPISDPAEKFLEPEQLKVFSELPQDEINTTIDESFVPVADEPTTPNSASEWETQRDAWLAALKEKTFRGWPQESAATLLHSESIPQDDLITVAYELGAGEENHDPQRAWLIVVTRPGVERPAALRLHVLDQKQWDQLERALNDGEATARFLAAHSRSSEEQGATEAYAFLAPRGVGRTAWSGDERKQVQIRRRYMLLGQTLAGMQILDVCRALQALRQSETYKDVPVSLHGTGDSAVLALYASLFEPKLERLELTDLPASHREGPDLLNVLRVLDVPQAVAIAADRCPVVLRTRDSEAWAYPQSIATRLNWDSERLQIAATSE